MVADRGAFLVTGATGNLGAAVVRHLLRTTDARVHALVRPGGADLLRFGLGEAGIVSPARLSAISGDVTAPLCGVDPAALADVTDIVHCAADVRWRDPAEVLFAVNVGGWRNLFDLAVELDRHRSVRRVSAVSTAYVAPRRIARGRVAPATPYETSKILAERVAAAQRLPVTIVRPSTLVGDRTTGRIESFTGAYFLLRLLAAHRIPCFPGYPDALVDLVAVDDAARIIVDAHDRSDAPGILPIAQGNGAMRLGDTWAEAAALLDRLLPAGGPRRAGFFLPPAPARSVLDVAGRVAGRARWRDVASYMPYVARRDPLPSHQHTAGDLAPVRALLEPMLQYALSVGFRGTRRRLAAAAGA